MSASANRSVYCDRNILVAAIIVKDQPAEMDRSAIVQSLLQGIEYEAGIGCPANTPAIEIACATIDPERHVNESVLG